MSRGCIFGVVSHELMHPLSTSHSQKIEMKDLTRVMEPKRSTFVCETHHCRLPVMFLGPNQIRFDKQKLLLNYSALHGKHVRVESSNYKAKQEK